jgi:hypothetical protein
VLDELAIGDFTRKTEGESKARAGTKTTHEQLGAATGPVALDVLEQKRRPLLLEHAPGDGANLAIPVDLGRDTSQLSRLLQEAYPLPHIHEAHRGHPNSACNC